MFCVTKLACSALQSVRQSCNKPLGAPPEVRYLQGGSDHQRGGLLLSVCHNRHRQPLQFKRNMCCDSGFLDRKNVIFIGGLGSIGMATSREICKAGPKNLIVLDKIENDDAIEELCDANAKTKVAYYNYDVTGSVGETCKLYQKIFNRFKTIDLLINGAGMLDDHQIETTIAVNFTGLVNTTTAIMPFWDKRNGGPGGVVANICSVTGMNAIHQVPVYSATTAAAFSFTNSVAKLEKITGVSAYSINPGITKTTLVENFNSWLDVEPDVAELLLEHPTQTTKQCAKKLVEAIQQNMNGAIWKLDLGRLSMVDWPVYWNSHI